MGLEQYPELPGGTMSADGESTWNGRTGCAKGVALAAVRGTTLRKTSWRLGICPPPTSADPATKLTDVYVPRGLGGGEP